MSSRQIYQRHAGGERVGAGARRVQTAPALVPLVVGFVLLVGLVVVLGYSGARQLNEVSDKVLDLQRRRGEQLRLLIDLRSALNELNNEARARADQRARGGIIPPFALRLREARSRLSPLAARLDDHPLIAPADKEQFADDLGGFLDATESTDRYNIEGFEGFRRLTTQLDRFRQTADKADADIEARTNELQQQANRSIRTTMLFAVLAGLAVAIGTIWEVQRRFRQVRLSFEATRREREFSAQILEGMPTAIAAFDRGRKLRSANDAFTRIFPNMTIGSSVSDYISDNPIAADAIRLLNSATSGNPSQAAYRGRWRLEANDHDADRADAAATTQQQPTQQQPTQQQPTQQQSAQSTFDLYTAPLTLDDQQGLILTLVDVNEAVAADEKLRAQAALAAVGQAAAQVAHEIKNPLGSIRLGVSLLREMTQEPDAQDTILLIERGIDHLNKLTVDVTQFSRVRPLELSQIDLSELIESSLELVKDKITDKRLHVERRFTAEPLKGEADADQLRQVFVNLLANAADATPEQGTLTITIDARRRERAESKEVNDSRIYLARISIRDTGGGMNERTQRRLFEPFFTTKKRGTGLGLAVVKKIVEQHGGTIEMESKIGEGTTFTIQLPI